MEFLVLGPLEVLEAGRPVSLRSAKQRMLLAALLTRANAVVSTDRLADILWGDSPPADATAAVQTYVSRLRGRAAAGSNRWGRGGAAAHARAPGYLLQVQEEQLDASRFERLVARAHDHAAAGEPGDAASVLDEALGLWRGPAFAEFADDDFVRTEALRLEELRLLAVEERVEANLSLGRHAELIGELEGIVAEQPLRERPRAQLMLALYRCGREAEALRSYQQYRGYLADELGLEPSARIVALDAAIAHHEPDLDWVQGAAAVPVAAAPSDAAAPAAGAGGAPSRDATRQPTPRTAAPPRVGGTSYRATGTVPLVGRRAELDWLAHQVDAVETGEPRIVFVRGDAGSGKSRLARELGRRATARGSRS